MPRTCAAQLPNGWLWDMVDEFVYQFQSWAQFRGKAAARGGEDLAALKQCERDLVRPVRAQLPALPGR